MSAIECLMCKEIPSCHCGECGVWCAEEECSLKEREIWNKAIDEFKDALLKNEVIDKSAICEIAEKMKGLLMTIDEAIESKKKLVHEWTNELSLTPNNDITHLRRCQDMISYYNQEIEWLEELKFLRQWKSDVMEEFCKYDCSSVEEARHNAYNNAINDVYDKIDEGFCNECPYKDFDNDCYKNCDHEIENVKEWLKKLLKGSDIL